MNSTGTVYLVGGGCGSADLITVRGMRLLQQCDAVVYDALIDCTLLELVPDHAEKICVGKRAGKHSESQEQINQILITLAADGKTVVRLKGGDPFVFGRGGEEILALRQLGIPCCVVPGISSAIAVPELAGIPVTHRRVSRSFHVITGHTVDETAPEHLRQYAQSDGTLVFLMGLRHLRQITEGLLEGGMPADMPAAVISHGGTVRQRIIRGALCNIAERAQNAEAPAVIVVGETAGIDFSAGAVLPLSGVSAALTGTHRFRHKLTEQLQTLGASVRCCCQLTVKEYEEHPALDAAIKRLQTYDWMVFTSANGVEIFLRRIRKQHTDIRALSGIRIAVLGSGTSEALARYGIFADLIPPDYTSESLGAALSQAVHSHEKILILRAEQGSRGLTDALDQSGAAYEDLKIYDVAASDSDTEQTVCEDYLVFASASGVRAFFAQQHTIAVHTKVVCIGAATAAALHTCGVKDFLIAEEHSAEGIVRTILQEANK